nr:unnamed protein product [Callosobruchus analis]
MRTLKELAVTESHRFPRAAEVLENSVFVDDIVSGANDISEALKLQSELISLLKCGGFELKKWMSNVPDLLQSVSQSWQLARIIRLHPGHDKVARVATVKTVNGTMQRPIAKLCPLPLFNPIENIQTGSTNSIARMNFVWTRERSRRSNTTAGENGRTVGSCFKEKHLFTFFHFFCVTTTYEKP